MKIIYSKYTFEEVHNTRRKWLSDEPGTSHEKIKIVLRFFPFLVYFLFCEYFNRYTIVHMLYECYWHCIMSNSDTNSQNI